MASIRSPLAAATELAAADDLNGGTATLDLSGAAGAVIAQVADGTAGTAGIDIVEVSKDGGTQWEAAAIRNAAGTAIATGVLNAAGVEPVGAALFTMHPRDGQMDGPTLIRVTRGTNWVTGAPSVDAIRIG